MLQTKEGEEKPSLMMKVAMSKVQACESSGNMRPQMVPHMELMWAWQGKKAQK